MKTPPRATADAIRHQDLWYVYLLRCNDGRLYTGCTSNIEDRINRHEKGYIPITKNRRPVELIVYTAFTDKYKAYEFEKYMKSGSGRAFSKRHFQ